MKLQVTPKVQLEIYINYNIPDFKYKLWWWAWRLSK